MIDTTQLAAIIASGLVNNDLYRKCTHVADYSQNRPAAYVLDVESVARDAWAIATRIEFSARHTDLEKLLAKRSADQAERNRNTR